MYSKCTNLSAAALITCENQNWYANAVKNIHLATALMGIRYDGKQVSGGCPVFLPCA
jgi:hypothetical protein